MEQLEQKIEALEKKIEGLQHSIDKIKKIFFWILIITVILFVFPLIGLIFAIPSFLNLYSGAGLGL